MAFHDEYKSFDIQELESGLHLFLEPPDLEIVSVEYLLGRFYDDLDPDDPLTCKPLVMVLNPEVRGTRYYLYDDVWAIQYRRNFRVIVFKNNQYVTGPHATKLYYRSYQTQKLYWLASMQISGCMFYNEDSIAMHMLTHLSNRDFYASEKGLKDKIPK